MWNGAGRVGSCWWRGRTASVPLNMMNWRVNSASGRALVPRSTLVSECALCASSELPESRRRCPPRRRLPGVPMRFVLRLSVLVVVTGAALVAGFAGPSRTAHAEVLPRVAEAGDVDSPALPSVDETSTEPQLPQGSFDIPPHAVIDPAPPVEPLAPPPTGSAVATWNYTLTPEDRKLIEETFRSTSKSSSAGGATTERPAQVAPAFGGEGAVAPSVTKPVAQRAPFLRTVGGCVGRGTPANAAHAGMSACCAEVLRPACIAPRSNLRLIGTQLPG